MDKASDCIVPVHIFQCPFQAPPISASRFSTVLFQAYILLGSPKHLIKKIKTINQTIFFFFFLIGNGKKFIKKKLANLSTLGMMYCGGKNQEPKLQWSSKAGREKQEKYNKATLQTRRVYKKKD